jgi:hypothetical protein
MSSLISVPAAPLSPADAVVEADGWYPAIDCTAARKVLRLGDGVTHERLVSAILGAMITVMGELRQWRTAQDATGATNIEAVDPDAQVGGEHKLKLLFTRAVVCTVGAQLAETHRDVSATADGEKRADQQLLSAGDYRREATWAIRDILGVPRTCVELL